MTSSADQASRALADPVRRAQYLAIVYLAAAEDARAPLIAEANALRRGGWAKTPSVRASSPRSIQRGLTR